MEAGAEQKAKYSVSSSALGSYFHNQCDLYLHLHGDRTQHRINRAQPSQLQTAIFEKGNQWEQRLVNLFGDRGCLIDGANVPAIDLLNLQPAHYGLDELYIYHARWEVPDVFYGDLDRKLVHFRFVSWIILDLIL